MRKLALVFLLASGICHAQSGGPYEITRQTIDGGGGISADVDFQATGTVGQPETVVSISGPYELRGGFWTGSIATHLFRDSLETQLPNRAPEGSE